MANERSSFASGLLIGCLALVGGCGENIQPAYSIGLLTPPGQTPLASATSVTLEALGTNFRTTTLVVPGQTPALRLKGLDPKQVRRTTFTVTVEGASGPIAYGQSPSIALSREENFVPLLILVQEFGTFAQPSAEPIIPRLSESHVVSARARDERDAPLVATPVIFGSRTLDQAGREQPAPVAFMYNPFLHDMVPTAVAPAATTGASVWARDDGTIWHFGGRVLPRLDPMGQPIGNAPLTFGSTAWKMGVAQYLESLEVGLLAQYPSQLGRADAAITEVPSPSGGLLYVFGGEALEGTPPVAVPQRSVLLIDPNASTTSGAVAASTFTMGAARTRHTATTVTFEVPATDTAPATTRTEVLIFGGLPATQPPPTSPQMPATEATVAEVFDPSTGAFAPLGPAAGANRFDHAVIRLPDGRLLIACGSGGMGPPTDARIYDPYARDFVVAPFNLAKPRSQAVCFAAGGDLVIAGGHDAEGALLGDAEIFDLLTFAPLGVVPVAPRAGARATPMPDGTTLVISGREAGAEGLVPSSVVEFYRPRRTR